MAQIIGVQGLGLPTPGALYPVTLGSPAIPSVTGTNALSLAPGDAVLIPSGTFMVTLGLYTSMQVQDPVTQAWLFLNSYGPGDQCAVNSDGQNYRVINPTGFPVAAIVTASGTGYTGVPTVAASAGGSTWTAVLGPSVSGLICNSATASASGVGYGIAPLINISAPPSPGVQATATCTLSGGAIASFTIINPGANYTSIPAVTVVPHPFDPNYLTTSTVKTTGATVTAQTSYGGQVAAVLLNNQGNVLTAPAAGSPLQVGLTFSGGAGSGAAATAIVPQTVVSLTVTSGGANYPAGASFISSGGGSIATLTSGAGAQNNSPLVSTSFVQPPRQCMFSAVGGSGTGVQVGTLIDGGLLTAVPVLFAQPGDGGFKGVATMGGASDTVYITPL